MENYAYATSYPDSGQSSPRSREIDFDATATWDEQATPTATSAPVSSKAKFMCSYGGKIQPRPYDNQLSYTGGETKILVVERGIKFSGLIGRLSALCDAEVCFKYQLPGEDLDALISVTNDDDLDHMMHEYDRLYKLSSKPARLRLFLFPLQTPAVTPSGSFGSTASERERLVEALNSVPPQALAPPQPMVAPPPANNVDFLFGLEKGAVNQQLLQQQPVATARPHVPNPDHDVSGRVMDDPIQRHIQDLKRLQIGGQGGPEAVHRRRSDDNLGGGGFSGDYYGQKVPENLPTTKMQGNMQQQVQGPGGVYQTTMQPQEQAVYMMQPQAGMYHPQMGRVPVTAAPNQGYYAVQRMPPDFYREQQQQQQQQQQQPYGLVTQVGGQTMAPPQTVAGYPEGYGMVRSNSPGGVGMVDPGYAHMAYDNGMGRQVYYNAPAGVVAPQYPAGMEMRAVGVATNQDGKAVKTTQASV